MVRERRMGEWHGPCMPVWFPDELTRHLSTCIGKGAGNEKKGWAKARNTGISGMEHSDLRPLMATKSIPCHMTEQHFAPIKFKIKLIVSLLSVFLCL